AQLVEAPVITGAGVGVGVDDLVLAERAFGECRPRLTEIGVLGGDFTRLGARVECGFGVGTLRERGGVRFEQVVRHAAIQPPAAPAVRAARPTTTRHPSAADTRRARSRQDVSTSHRPLCLTTDRGRGVPRTGIGEPEVRSPVYGERTSGSAERALRGRPATASE